MITLMKFLMVLLLITRVVSDAKPAPDHYVNVVRVNPSAGIGDGDDEFTCSSACDGNYMVCHSVIRNVYEHFICLKVRSGCKRRCRHPETKVDVIITPLTKELDKIWNSRSWVHCRRNWVEIFLLLATGSRISLKWYAIWSAQELLQFYCGARFSLWSMPSKSNI